MKLRKSQITNKFLRLRRTKNQTKITPQSSNIIEAKTQFIDRDGLKFGVRTLEDVERVAKLCGAFPRLSNIFFQSKFGGDLLKKSAGIHRKRQLTLEFVRTNVDRLAEAVASGYDIVCSCPTCGFMLRNLLKEGAYYSTEYQASVSNNMAYLQVPAAKATHNPGKKHFKFIPKSIYGNLFKDDGYFSSIDPLKRIKVAENTYDLGEYLVSLHRAGELKTSFADIAGRMVYYPPGHLREQNIGRPYQELLKLLPGIDLEPIDGALDCCGMAGIMGFKKEFHKSSVHLGKRLMEKIKAVNPEQIVTDCLSCRLQFQQLLPYKVIHPIELLKESYERYRK